MNQGTSVFDLLEPAPAKRAGETSVFDLLEPPKLEPLTAAHKFQEIKEAPEKLIPFVGAGVEALEMADIYGASRAMQAGTAKPEQEKLVQSYLRKAERPTTLGYDIVNILSQVVPFAGEFAASGGALAVGKATAKKALGKVLREGVEEAAGRAAKRGILSRAARFTADTAAQTAIMEGVSTALAGGGRIQAEAYMRALPVLEDDAGRLSVAFDRTAEGFAEALPRAVWSGFVETLTERSGGALLRVTGLRALQTKVAEWWLAKYPGKGANGLLREVAGRTGWNGVLGEYLEERAGAAIRGATPGMEESLEDVFPGWQQTAAELAAFSVPTAGGAIIRSLGGPERIPKPNIPAGTAQGEGVPSKPAGPADTTSPVPGPKAEAEPAPASQAAQALLQETGTQERAQRAFPGARPVEAVSEREKALAEEFAGEGVDLLIFEGSETALTRPASALGRDVVGVSREALQSPTWARRLRWHEPVHVLKERFPEEFKAFADAVEAISPARQRLAEKEYADIFRLGEEERVAETVGPFQPGREPKVRELGPLTLAEEGLAYRAEGLWDWLDRASSPEGLRELEKAAAVPSLWRKIVNAVRRMLGLEVRDHQEAMTALEVHRALRKLRGAVPARLEAIQLGPEAEPQGPTGIQEPVREEIPGIPSEAAPVVSREGGETAATADIRGQAPPPVASMPTEAPAETPQEKRKAKRAERRAKAAESDLAALEEAAAKAQAAVDALGPQPPKPSSERARFGARGREGADPAAVERYDAEVRAYSAWNRKRSKLSKAKTEADNALHAARSRAREMQEEPPFAAAWHGSGSEFDRFSNDKIGSGEGAQAYGWGHYFAGAREVGQYYKEQAARSLQAKGRVFVDGAPLRDALPGLPPDELDDVAIALDFDKGDVEASVSAMRAAQFPASVVLALESLRGRNVEVRAGRLYHVDLAPQEDEYLLHDAPMSQQSEKVRQALESVDVPMRERWKASGAWEHVTGRVVYQDIASGGRTLGLHPSRDVEGQKRASALLHSAGIRGIKYLDGTSRAKGEGAFNYVVFDSADISIQEKFAAAPPPRRLLQTQRQAFGPGQVSAETSTFIRRWIDAWNPVKDLQEAIVDANGTVSADPYNAEKRRRAKTGQAIREFKDAHLKPLLQAVRDAGVTLDTGGDHMEYRHADERDAYVATKNPELETGSGWTEERKRAHEATIAGKDLSTIGRLWDAAWKALRAKWVEYGLETQDFVDQLEAQYQHYSPLRGFRDEAMADVLGWGRGISLRGGQTRRALGRTSAAANPFTYLLADIEKAMRAGEKARVQQAFIELVEGNPTLGWASLSVPHIRRGINKETGLVEIQPDPTFANDPNVVPLRQDGANRYLTLAPSHAHLAPVLKAENIDYPPEGLQAIARFTRTLAKLSTRWNPFFLPYNFVRDFGQATFLTASERGALEAGRLATRVVQNGVRYMRAYAWAKANPNGQPSTPTQALALRYLRSGAEVTFLDLGGLENAAAELRAALETPGPAERLARATTRTLGAMQDAVENLTRLATFDLATEGGMAEERAAVLAKGISTNFEQRGDLGTWLNSFFAFSNAGIQGNVRLLQGLSEGRFGRRALASTIAGAVLVDAMNAILSGDDDDGRSYYDNIPDWEKRTNLILMNPLSDRGDYFKVPLPYGFNFLHTLGTMTGHAMRGVKEPMELASEIIQAGADAFNPLGGGTDFADIVTPTVLDPIVQVARNRAWHGGPIRPPYQDIDRKLPDSEKFYPATANPGLVRFARLANKLTGGTSFEPGFVDISPETIEHLLAAYTGGLGGEASRILKLPFLEERELSDVPLARRVYATQRASRHRQRYMDQKLRLDRIRLGLRQQETPEARAAYAKEHQEDLVLAAGVQAIDRQIERLRELQKRTEDDRLQPQIDRLYILANRRMAEARR